MKSSEFLNVMVELQPKDLQGLHHAGLLESIYFKRFENFYKLTISIEYTSKFKLNFTCRTVNTCINCSTCSVLHSNCTVDKAIVALSTPCSF